ncbi:F-box/kelch-repeat protein [Senna tora]|uniref:F-box/kelch-repeat protein n=1 Tax=Senna tora TaxID=362788 RepID=A0A835CK57_9FABA|nr:F-box/kelch-repeat protein [Senna tora]
MMGISLSSVLAVDYYVFPITHHHILPLPFFGTHPFENMTEDFKVVRFVSLYDDQDTHPQVEVYSLASGSWKSVTNSSSRAIPNYFTDWDAHSSPAQIVIRGVIHWVVSQKSSNGETHKFILSFDLRKETFGELMLPKVVRELCRSEASILQGDCCNTRLNYKWEKHCFRFFRKFLKMKKKDGSFGDEDRWEKVFRFDSRCCYGCVKNIVGLKTNGEVFLELLSGRLLLVRKIATHMLSTTSCKDTSVGCFVESLFLLSKQNNAFSYT